MFASCDCCLFFSLGDIKGIYSLVAPSTKDGGSGAPNASRKSTYRLFAV